MFAPVSLDDDVADDVVAEDHGSNEGEGEVVKVGGQEGQDGSPADDVKNVEDHSDHQLTVGGPDCKTTKIKTQDLIDSTLLRHL